jgi:uncharacterized protein with HEPN domain
MYLSVLVFDVAAEPLYVAAAHLLELGVQIDVLPLLQQLRLELLSAVAWHPVAGVRDRVVTHYLAQTLDHL